VQDVGTFILAGSRRLITERGMFGNNLDVLGHDHRLQSGGYVGAGGGRVRNTTAENIVAVELVLDLAILEDGRCVGPDESGLFESLREDLERIRSTAQQVAKALRDGASAGHVFEMLRPLARHTPGDRPPSPFAGMFGNMAIHRLVGDERAPLTAWFETQAQPLSLRLYKPSAASER
jgi:hypothetical protein